nr:hypothetical protein [Sulfurimonas sp.]
MIKVFFILLIAMSLQADSLKMLVSFLKMDYEERSDSGDFLDSEKSDYTDIIGAELEYKLDLSKGHGGADIGSLLLSGSYQEGESKYDGFLQSGGAIVSSYKTTTDIKIIKPKVRWLEMKRGVRYDVGIFTSLAYRYWKRDSSSDKYGYLEEYKWGYVDAGLMAIFHDEKWHIGFEAAYQKAINPTLYAGVNGGLDFDL